MANKKKYVGYNIELIEKLNKGESIYIDADYNYVSVDISRRGYEVKIETCVILEGTRSNPKAKSILKIVKL